ncbi:MAG: Mbov_0395 family pilin-like conjugal transfer protein [Patescibacteria group bacterium]
MNKIKKQLLALMIFFSMLLIGPACIAGIQDAFNVDDGSNEDPLDKAASESGYDTGQTSINPIIQTVIQVALSFLGVIFLILMIYGGFLWMTASGNEEKVSKARKILTAAIIGLIIVIGAYAITALVMSRLGGEVLN